MAIDYRIEVVRTVGVNKPFKKNKGFYHIAEDPYVMPVEISIRPELSASEEEVFIAKEIDVYLGYIKVLVFQNVNLRKRDFFNYGDYNSHDFYQYVKHLRVNKEFFMANYFCYIQELVTVNDFFDCDLVSGIIYSLKDILNASLLIDTSYLLVNAFEIADTVNSEVKETKDYIDIFKSFGFDSMEGKDSFLYKKMV